MFRCCVIVSMMCACLTLSGCAQSESYAYAGIRYSDPQKALDAQRINYEKILARIQPLDQPLADKALVILPDRELIWTTQITGPKESVSKVMREWLLTSFERSHEFIVRTMVKRQIFEEVEVQQSNKPEELLAGDYDAIIYESPNLKQMLIRLRGQMASTPVSVDESTPTGYERMMSQLRYMENLLAEL